MKVITQRAGPLVVRTVDDDGASPEPALLCVLCHGYGAPGTDLVSLAGELVARRPALRGKVRFAFPEAPLALEDVPFGGRAWWALDIVGLQRALATGDAGALLDEAPPGLAEARRQLLEALEALQRAAGLDMRRTVLGGFSQGAMLATDAALRADEPPAGLIVFSGTLLTADAWRKLAGRRRGLPVTQSHGLHDPLLPFARAESLRALLEEGGASVRFHAFPGGHGLDEGSIENAADLLDGALARTASSSR
jgi:phospholipase/carboxylesterase